MSNKNLIPNDASLSEVFSLKSISLYTFGPFTAPAVFFFYMVANFVVYLLTVYLADTGALGRFVRKLQKRSQLEPLPLPSYQDSDVNAEKERIHQMTAPESRDMLTISDLRRVYPGRGRIAPRVAVNDLCLGVPAGQCFGLLGPNGAGKTTTMKMLTGDDVPQGGDAWINGHSVRDSLSEVYKVMGYCPQFDQVWPELTGKEHLEIFAAIKGVPAGAVREEMINKALEAMTLLPYGDKRTKSYSGGNRRKLSVALALLANPKVTYLDEPSTGMDPASRRYMWDLISATMGGRAVVLTTHSMEEADALCQRIGIVINGTLQAVGSAQHLKNKFGQGYLLETKAPEALAPKVEEFIMSSYPKALLTDSYGEMRNFVIPQGELKLPEAFALLESHKSSLGIIDYSLSQASLEQVFLRFAKNQVDEEAIEDPATVNQLTKQASWAPTSPSSAV